MTVYTSPILQPRLEIQLLRLWNKFLNRSDLTIDDDFFESGGDSILAAELLLEVEQLMQTTIPPSLLFETGTVRLLAERLNRKEGLTAKVAVRIGGDQGRLFHFFHGDFTYGGVSARRLTAPLGRDRPTLAIAPHGLAGEQVPISIEQMAVDRLPVILGAQPRGPFILGGHCAGALVAFETARLLVNAGHRVDLVVMIDPVVVSLRPSAQLLMLTQDLTNRAMGMPGDTRLQSLERTWKRLAKEECRLRQYVAGFKKVSVPRLKPAKSLRVPDPELNSAYARVLLTYRPARLAVPVLYFALQYSGGGWRGMSPEIELIDLPSIDHQLRGDGGTAIMGLVRGRLNALDALSKY